MVIGALDHAMLPPQAVQVPSNSQEARVAQVSKPIFQRVKEALSRAWSATVIGIKAAGDKISFVFFRVLEWIHPSLGPKIENVFLRIGNIFRSIKDAWKQEEIRKEMDRLRAENYDFRIKVQLFAGATEQNERLKLDLTQLQGEIDRVKQAHCFLEQEKATLDQRFQVIVCQQDHIRNREDAVVRQRDLLVGKSDRVEKEKEELIIQRDLAARALFPALGLIKDLQEKLAQALQEVADLRGQLRDNLAMGESLDFIARACNQGEQLGQKTEVDDNLEKLLPLLLRQIEEAQSKLEIAKQSLPSHSSATSPLQSFERILAAVVESLKKIPQALKLHANWQEPVSQLLSTQQR